MCTQSSNELPDGARIVVSCNPHGQPIGEEGGVLGKFLGVIAKNGAYCPLNEHDWRKVKKDGGDETILQCVQTQFLCPPSCKKWILKTVGRDWRRYKATLKKGIFKPNANKKRKALYKLCPEDVEEDQWKELVKFWKSKEGRDLSEKNKRSRSLVKTNHTAGTKSFARWAEDIRQKDPEKRQPHRAIVYLATHRKRPKDNQPEPVQNEHVIQLEDLIDNQPKLAQNDRGRIAWEGDALHQVLGEEKAGQVHGMGLLPIPKQVYGRLPRRFKNMNISTQDTSYEGGADEREEIARLWEHIQKQDLVIEQLRNQQGSHENNETARENHQENFADNSQTHVANFVRKRVCNTPDQQGFLTRERETTLNKDTLVENHDMYTDNDEEFPAQKYLEHGKDNGLAHQHGSSSIPLSTNGFLQEKNKTKQNFQDTTARTRRQQDTQRRTQCHIPSKRKHSSSMEIEKMNFKG